MNYQSGPEEPKRIDELSPRAPLATDFIPICPANGPTYKASLKDIADLTPSPIPPIGPGNVGQILSVGGGLSPEWVTASAGGGGGTVLPDGDAINSCLVWDGTAAAWVPARLVQEAQNIHSGGVGTIPYQIGEHKTAHLNIGTKGQILTVEQLAPTMFLPKWADAAAGLPVSSIADASKVLTVKADGTGVEWGTKVNLLEVDAPPVTGAIGNSVTIAAGNGNGGDFLGGDVKIKLGQPSGTEAGRSSFFVYQFDGGHALRTDPKKPAIVVVGGNHGSTPFVSYAMQVWAWNSGFGTGNGDGILFGPSEWSPGVINRIGRTARIFAELDNTNTQGSRLVFQTTEGAGTAYKNGLVIWSNGAATVGVSNIGIHAPPIDADSIQAAGTMQALKGFVPTSLADTAAANNRIYFSTTANKLVFKDSAGVVHPLYT